MNWFISRVRRLWGWVKKRPKKVTIPITVIVVIVLSFGGYWFTRFYNYVQEDPNFCRSCHLMEEAWDRWATSEHKDIGCHRCHEQNVFAGAKQVIDFAFARPGRIERHAVVQDESCGKCHESGNPKWLQVAATSGHNKHVEEQNIACTKCHSVTLHRFIPPEPICQICHTEQQVKVSGMEKIHCSACHDYLATTEDIQPLRKNCLDCHQTLTNLKVNWPADAPMQFRCGECHQPHQQARPIVNCLSCHTVEGEHLDRTHRISLCQTCHQPHQWQVTRRETCLSCHPASADHNAGILCSNCHTFSGR